MNSSDLSGLVVFSGFAGVVVLSVVLLLRASRHSAEDRAQHAASEPTATVRGVVEPGTLLLGPVSARPCVGYLVVEEEDSLTGWSPRSRATVVADFVVRDAGTAHLIRGAGAVAEIVPAGRHCLRAAGPGPGRRRFEAIVPEGELVVVSGRICAAGDLTADYREAGARLALTGDAKSPLRVVLR